MATFGEIVDDVGAAHLSELHEAESEPVSDDLPEPPQTPSSRSGHVVRRFVGSQSKGLVHHKVVSKTRASKIARQFNQGRKPGDPKAHVHKL